MPTAADIKARLMVGMEIHVELSTRSKMFTSAPNVAHPDYFDAEPNSLCDPVVLGMPGVLPVMNRRAVEMSMLVGLALGCKINRKTKWDRKSYYYPDLPKNYQISQYDLPLCYEGAVEVPVSDQPGAATKTVRIIRAHLEEDAGKLMHEAPGGFAIDYSIVDLNRSGTPLLEIVTYPDFDSAEQVVAFGQALRNICRFLGVTEGIMQKGHMRFEPNINVVIEHGGQTYKTPIVEIKNLNSFKALYGAVKYEYERQVEDWLETGVVMKPGTKSTRGWDDGSETTFLQREKEEAHDYRYFPDPDLVHVSVDDAWLASIHSQLPELPLAREKRYVETLGMSVKDARALIDEPKACLFFETVLTQGVEPKRATSFLLNNLAKRANERACRVDELGISASQIKVIADLAASDKIGSAAADELIGLCCEEANAGMDPLKLAEQRGLLQVSDESSLDAWIEQVISQNEKVVAQIKAGKESAIMSLMGGVMKLSKGKANAKVVQEKLRKALLG